MPIGRRAFAALSLGPLAAAAQPPWSPERPVSFLGPYAAGGSFDVTQRAMARAAETRLGQPIAVVNRPGAGGTIMLNELARARPDGLTLGLLSVNTNAVAPQLLTMTVDPVADFTPIMTYGSFLTFVAVASNAPWASLADLLGFARREPGRLTVGVAAIGANSHLNMARLFAEEGVEVTFVPFVGGAPANTALLGGHIQCAVVSGEILPTVRDGSLRLLAILNAEKSEEFPAVPTLPELGYSWSARPWLGFGGPRGLPAAVTARWTEVLEAARESSEVQTVMRRLAFVPLRTRGEAMRQLMAESLTEHERVARAIRIGRFAPS